MTPKRLEAMLFVASKRIAHEQLSSLTLHSLAARGGKEQIDKFVKELQK